MPPFFAPWVHCRHHSGAPAHPAPAFPSAALGPCRPLRNLSPQHLSRHLRHIPDQPFPVRRPTPNSIPSASFRTLQTHPEPAISPSAALTFHRPGPEYATGASHHPATTPHGTTRPAAIRHAPARRIGHALPDAPSAPCPTPRLRSCPVLCPQALHIHLPGSINPHPQTRTINPLSLNPP